MATGDRKDHYGSFNFHVEIEGIAVGAFRHVSGLKSETEVFEYVEGGDNDSVRRLVGQSKPANIILKKGVIPAEGDLWSFRKDVADSGDNPIKRRNGSIVLRDDAGAEKARWNFQKAWCVRWEVTDLDSGTNEVAVETVELAVERLEKS